MTQGPRSEGTRRGRFVLAVTLVATLGGFLFGYDTAVISGAVESLERYMIAPLRSDAALGARTVFEFKVSVMATLAVVALSIGGILIKLFGRARGLALTVLPVAAAVAFLYRGFLGESSAPSEEMLAALKGFVISSALVGCIPGAAIAGFVSERLGRKRGLVLAAVLLIISAIGSGWPDTLNVFACEITSSFVIYRIIGGVGVGIASMLAPMYIAEIAPSEARGRLVSWNQFAIILGMLIVYFVNYGIALQGDATWNVQQGWRYMLGSEALPGFLFLGLLFLVPETPRFLAGQGRSDEAKTVLERIYGAGKQANEVFAEIRASMSGASQTAPWLSYGGLVLVVGALLSAFQQVTGINVVLYYAPEIFKAMGTGRDAALMQTIIVGAINLAFTVLAIVTVDRWGRKPLMVIGAVGMAISMTALGFMFHFQAVGVVTLLFMLLYVASFAMSWGPVTWVYLAEMFPNRIRGAMSVAVAVQWVSNLIVSWTFPMMNDNRWLTERFHHGFSFWVYGAMGLGAAVFMLRVVPETKGHTLEDMEHFWTARSRSNDARRSAEVRARSAS